MRRIIKQSRQPDFLREWKGRYRRRAGRSATYSDLQHNHAKYHEMKEALMREQYFLCCYCCNRVVLNYCHIENFIPQSVDGSKQLDYQNMFASCNGYIQDISTVDRESCGHRKSDWYDQNHILSPVDPECEELFNFLPNGEILPKNNDDVRARKMIEHLGLDSYALTKAREIAVDVALHSIGFFDDSVDETVLNDEIEFNRIPNSHGVLPPFCDAVLYVLQNL